MVLFRYGLLLKVSRGSVVVITTRYVRDGPGNEYQREPDFSHLSRVALGPTQPSVQWVPGLFPRVKTAGAWLCPNIPSTDEFKVRTELCFYKPAGTSRFVLG